MPPIRPGKLSCLALIIPVLVVPVILGTTLGIGPVTVNRTVLPPTEEITLGAITPGVEILIKTLVLCSVLVSALGVPLRPAILATPPRT